MVKNGIRITPRVVEFRNYVIATRNISSVAIAPDPTNQKWGVRLVGLAFVFAILGLFANDMFQSPYSRGGTHRSVAVVCWTLASICGIVGWTQLNKLTLFIVPNGGNPLTLMTDNEHLMRDVLERIREAMIADEDSPLVYQVNVSAKSIERLDASNNAVTVTDSPNATVSGGDLIEDYSKTNKHDDGASATSATAQTSGPETGAGRKTENSRDLAYEAGRLARNGLQMTRPLADRALHEVQKGQERIADARRAAQQPTRSVGNPAAATPAAGTISTQANTVTANNATGAVVAGGNVTNVKAHAEVRIEAIQSFDQLLEQIGPSYGDNLPQVKRWLKPVRDHLASNSGDPDEARSVWQTFTREHLPVFANLATVAELAGKVSRGLGLALL